MRSYHKWYFSVLPVLAVIALVVWLVVRPVPRPSTEPASAAPAGQLTLPGKPAMQPDSTPAAGAVRAEGIRVPDYDEQGRMKSEVYGDVARELPDGNIELFNLRLFLYKEGALDGTAETPRCIYNRKERMLFSNADITMQQGNMLVSGTGFRWFSDREYMEILNRAFVIIRDTRLWSGKEGLSNGKKDKKKK